MNNACISQAEFFIGLGPEHAASLARGRLTRDDVSSYLFDRARLPLENFDVILKSGPGRSG